MQNVSYLLIHLFCFHFDLIVSCCCKVSHNQCGCDVNNWFSFCSRFFFFQRFDYFSIQINQLEADLQELGSLVEKAERKRVQELLKQEQKKVEKELAVKRQQKVDQARREADPSAASKAPYTVKITNYGMAPKHNT